MFTVRWVLLATLASLVAAYGILVLFVPRFGAEFLSDRLATIPAAVAAHIAGGAIALFTGAFQVNARLRTRFLDLHRWFGRTYVVAVLAGSAGGFVMARRSEGGLATHVGFGLLAVLWLATTIAAYRSIRTRDLPGHRRWMLRSYALTFAAVTLRIYSPIAIASGVPFIDAYQAIAWACWVPNLIVVEWWLLRPARSAATPVAV
jgi:uncharacterized membrane protein